MDNHPIPQDVTHFQFKLVGELTIKQFGYVAAGGILAWIAFSLPILLLVKLLISLLFAGTGLIFAFVPVEGRPADLMLTHFFRALFKPNQYIYAKEGSYIAFAHMQPGTHSAPSGTNQFTQIHSPVQQPIMPPLPMQTSPQTPSPLPPVNQFSMPQANPQLLPIPLPATPLPDKNLSQVTTSMSPLHQQVAPVVQYQQAEQPIQVPVTQHTPPPQPVSDLAEQLQHTLSEKQQLEQQLNELKQQLAQNTQQPTEEPVPPAVVTQAPAPVVIKKANIPQPVTKAPMVSDFPNIVMGVVKDARGNVLPNILIEVKDGDDNPVRAFKTNALGQFASATPLLNGTYTMAFEDSAKKHTFDTLQVTATGEIMQPIEIISVDEREELRKELFG